MRTVRGWAPPLLGPLPDDFLRLTPTPWGVSQKKQVCVAVNAALGVAHVALISYTPNSEANIKCVYSPTTPSNAIILGHFSAC